MLTRRTWFERETLVPFSFKRRRCFLCDTDAVARVAGEPVCAKHKDLIDAIRREAERKETAA